MSEFLRGSDFIDRLEKHVDNTDNESFGCTNSIWKEILENMQITTQEPPLLVPPKNTKQKKSKPRKRQTKIFEFRGRNKYKQYQIDLVKWIIKRELPSLAHVPIKYRSELLLLEKNVPNYHALTFPQIMQRLYRDMNIVPNQTLIE